MAKGRKKTKGLGTGIPMFKEDSPAERVDYAAKNLVRTALETHPRMNSLAKKLGRAARQGTGKIIQEMGKEGRKESME